MPTDDLDPRVSGTDVAPVIFSHVPTQTLTPMPGAPAAADHERSVSFSSAPAEHGGELPR